MSNVFEELTEDDYSILTGELFFQIKDRRIALANAIIDYKFQPGEKEKQNIENAQREYVILLSEYISKRFFLLMGYDTVSAFLQAQWYKSRRSYYSNLKKFRKTAGVN